MRLLSVSFSSTHSRFFQFLDEENILNRIDNVMMETGALLPMTTELRTLIYLSDKVESRKQKRNNPT